MSLIVSSFDFQKKPPALNNILTETLSCRIKLSGKWTPSWIAVNAINCVPPRSEVREMVILALHYDNDVQHCYLPQNRKPAIFQRISVLA